MAAKTFSNEQLVGQWAKAVSSKGTRRDVVLGIMAELSIEDKPENYRKVYNNVTQRVKQLATSAKLNFQTLAEGKKGARRSGAEIASLQAILDSATAPAGDKTADEEAPASEGAEQPSF